MVFASAELRRGRRPRRPVGAAGQPTGGAKDAWRHLGMYSFRIERIHPQTPEEKFWEGFRFPSQTLLETTKGRAAALPLETFPGVMGDSGTKDVGTGDERWRLWCLRSFRVPALRKSRAMRARQISNRHWAFVDCRGGALSPPIDPRLMDVAIGSVGADLCVGP